LFLYVKDKKVYIATKLKKKSVTYNLITLNFEKNPEYKEISNSLDLRNILEKITLFTGKRIDPGKTLIFLMKCRTALQ